jgi:hypothetical protein
MGAVFRLGIFLWSLAVDLFFVKARVYRATRSAFTEEDAPDTWIGSEIKAAERKIEAMLLNEIISASLLTLTQIFNFSNLFTTFGEVATCPAAGTRIM